MSKRNNINDITKENIEIIFNKILEFNKIYNSQTKRDPTLRRSYEDAITRIIQYNLLGREKFSEANLAKLHELLDGFFNILKHIMYAIYRANYQQSCCIEEWRHNFDALSIKDSTFTYLVSSKQDSLALRVVCGSAYIPGERRSFRVMNLGTENKVAVVDGSLITSATLADKIKVLEVSDSLVTFMDNTRSWWAYIKSNLAKINTAHSIAVYSINILHNTLIRLRPIETSFINFEKTAALVNSLMSGFFGFFEEVHSLYDDGWDMSGSHLLSGKVFVKYINRFLDEDSRVSLLGLQVDTLVGDVEIIIPRESMSFLSIRCPPNVVLKIDDDKIKCDEKSYVLVKPPRPWSKESNSVAFVKLYINVAVDKSSSIKILFE